MQRRNFLRLAGGGVISAAAVPLAGCAPAMPAAAVAPWSEPAPEGDLRRWVLAHALLAPHSHNLQSWVADLRQPGLITLHCDLTRLLPMTDPFARQIVMSHGTFLEVLDLAARARGHRALIEPFPDGEPGPEALDERPVARIRLVRDDAIEPDALFAQIRRRHTHRGPYDRERPVPAQAWQAMAAACQRPGLRFGHVDQRDAQAMQAHRDIAAEAWRIELTTPRTILESYRLLRIGAAEVARHRDGLTLLDPMVVWLDRLGLFDRSQAPAADSFATTGQIDEFNANLASTPAYLWIASEGNRRVTQLDAGRAYARLQLAAAAHGVVMQPLSQALQEYEEQRELYQAIHRLVGAPAPAHTVQMWARVGLAAPAAPSPRRPLDAIIRA